MPKLHEIIAVVSGKKGEAEKAVTEAYHLLQKPEFFDGLERTYRPLEDGGEKLPPESKRPQHAVRDLVAKARARWADLFDLTATLDAGNQVAKADVEVDGKVVAKDVPVPTLLFLEKQLQDVKTFVSKLPTPDPAEEWKPDPNQGTLAAAPVETHRTKKVQKAIVLYHATPEHPAQTQLVSEDVLAGYWKTTKYTTRVPAEEKAAMLARAQALLDAVKTARERANSIAVEKKKVGDGLLAYVFGG
jgi:hypothetical protein